MFKFNFDKRKVRNQEGFFMLELIVALFIFIIVMTVSMGTLIVSIDANRKVQSLKSVLNNLDVAMETMTKAMAVGRYYRCDEPEIFYDSQIGRYKNNPKDCATDGGGSLTVSFMSNADLGSNNKPDDVVVYKFETGYISRTIHMDLETDPVVTEPIRMTAPEVVIDKDKSRFYVSGSDFGYGNGGTDDEQPKVLIVVNGEANSGPRSSPTEFTVQTNVSQRNPDF